MESKRIKRKEPQIQIEAKCELFEITITITGEKKAERALKQIHKTYLGYRKKYNKQIKKLTVTTTKITN